MLAELLEKHVRQQRRGFKDDEKMLPYTQAGLGSLSVLMRQARAPVGALLNTLANAIWPAK